MRKWILLTAGVAALALITTAAIAIPKMVGGSDVTKAYEPVIANGVKYVAPIEIDLSKDDLVTFDANVDLSELKERLIDEGESVTLDGGIIDIYADRELTIPITEFDIGSPADRGSGYVWQIGPLQAIDNVNFSLDLFEDGLGASSLMDEKTMFDREIPWSQYAEYWVKRSYDADGKKLEFPEVAQVIPKFDTERSDAINVSFSQGKEDGSVKLRWTAPAYADADTEYLIIKTLPNTFALSEDEAWSSEIIASAKNLTEYDTSDIRPDDTTQNTGLTLFSGDSADIQEYAGEGAFETLMNTSSARIGVVALHDGQYSPINLVTPDASVRAQPYSIAIQQQFDTRDKSQKYDVGDLTGLETWMPVITLD